MQPGSAISAFPTSQWSLIACAAAGDPEAARRALAELCRRYWYPLYVFVRRQLNSEHDAEDVTQGFFAHLLENDVIAAADPARGRFRTYLLACCKNYLANHRRAEQTWKKGGGVQFVGLDFGTAATRYAQEPADPSDPELLFLRRWAFTLLEETLDVVRADYAVDNRGPLFDRLRPTLIGDVNASGYADIARDLGLTEDAVKKAAQRLRARFKDELRRRIAETVVDPASIEDEIRDLFAAVR